MPGWTVEVEPEVHEWLTSLDEETEFARVAVYIDLLQERGFDLREPYARQLRGSLRELRFRVRGQSTRITYFIQSPDVIVLLTVFTKQRRREQREIQRALRAMELCVSRHSHG